MKIIIKYIFIILVLGASIILLRMGMGGDEDTWLCEGDRWVAHGKPDYPQPVINCGKPTLLPKNEADCLAQGGVWEKQGIDAVETCDRKTIDRGNLCRDNGQCEGLCQVQLTEDELKQGMLGQINKKVKYGQCSVWVVELGCQGVMKEGKVQVTCFD